MHADSACIGNADSLLKLFGAPSLKPENLPAEIGRRISAGWMSFRRYTRELYDRPKESLLHLKARIMEFKVVEALLYGCAT